MKNLPNKVLFTLLLCGGLLTTPAFGQSETNNGDNDITDTDPPVSLAQHGRVSNDSDLKTLTKNFNPFADKPPGVITHSAKRCIQFRSNTRQSF